MKKINLKNSTKENKNLIILLFLFLLTIYILISNTTHFLLLPIIDKKENPYTYIIFLVVLAFFSLFYGRDLLRNGLKRLIHKRPNADTIITISILSSLFYSIFSLIFNKNYIDNIYFSSCIIVIFFAKFVNYLNNKSRKEKENLVIEKDKNVLEKVLKKVDNKECEVPISDIKIGDILIAKPGMKFAVDGSIISGSCYIDSSLVTGRFFPYKKASGDKVIKNEINIDGIIEYQVEKSESDYIIDNKPVIISFPDKVCTYFLPIILLISIMSFILCFMVTKDFYLAFNIFIVIIIISCPCVSLLVSLSTFVSEGLCVKNKILVKNNAILDNVLKIDTVVFDKTGTLTYGKLELTRISNYGYYSDDEILTKVASIESRSVHPLSQVFMEYTKKNNLLLEEVTNFETLEGIGLSAKIDERTIYIGNNKLLTKLKLGYNKKFLDEEKSLSKEGNNVIYVIEENNVIALISIGDKVRLGAKEVIEEIKNFKRGVCLLSGDNLLCSKIIAKMIGIKEVIAEASRVDKKENIESLIKNDKKVMMVGDGYNDILALSKANVSISFESSTEEAKDIADVIFFSDDLRKIITLFAISKKRRRKIKQNLFISLCITIFTIFMSFKVVLTTNELFINTIILFSCLIIILNNLLIKK